MIVTVFGDDSADETKQRVFAVAGVIAEEKEWERLEGAWLDRTGGVPFHATDCESDQGIYKDKPHKENLELLQRLGTDSCKQQSLWIRRLSRSGSVSGVLF